ncbi:helix-turn-helix domain-containing protein [Candidatus Sordicultor fermentans]|uniref:helix-turn-helix domain-containing protein n=1 Tax=Candidatus Sordicultor fermentans TaxID=1953203 RepID=UPI0016B8A21C|nr:helix-turn-helix transcriptional regulator [Atribacterota bacterium]NLY05768.1 helix-turn-helix transcriptional regulator [Candidatus Atribacteria bacterium]HOA99670.1 helix-turn-helix transcriptional regulator [Candidatus Atribacteria bacterium]HQD32747.1 helix-turn-helix transcriptional regulator [Candidatus Atribacteria bacterium]
MFYNLLVMGDWQDKGQRLRELRNKKGWSVRGLAREMGVSKSTVSDVELGRRKPTANYLIKAAKTLGIAERELLEWYGYLEPLPPDLDQKLERVAREFDTLFLDHLGELNEESKKSLVDFLEYLIEKQKREDRD